jgi:hypothetical protein
MVAGGAAAADGATCEVVSSHFIPLIEGAVAEYIAKWQERAAPRGTAQQVRINVQPQSLAFSSWASEPGFYPIVAPQSRQHAGFQGMQCNVQVCITLRPKLPMTLSC